MRGFVGGGRTLFRCAAPCDAPIHDAVVSMHWPRGLHLYIPGKCPTLLRATTQLGVCGAWLREHWKSPRAELGFPMGKLCSRAAGHEVHCVRQRTATWHMALEW